jgi:trimethylamine-N-oxide reductase cytochrome c-type subunit TorC
MKSIRACTKGQVAVVLTAAVVVLAAAGMGAVHYTSQAQFCGSCHEMDTSHAGWTKGSHSKTHCYDCHVDKTLAGHVIAKANGLRQVYHHLTRKVDMDQVSATVPNHRCIQCHDTSDSTKLGERLAKAHDKHMEAKLHCTVCHAGTGHSREVFAGFKQDSCKECHSAKPQELRNPYLDRNPCTRSMETGTAATL